MVNFNIRQATVEDTKTIYDFIVKMANYEKLTDEVDTNEEAIQHSLFVENQAEVVLCEVDGRAVGFALYFFNFSTFKGQRGLYLEDIFVDQDQRGHGYGKALLLHLVDVALQRKCRRMEWIVLDWNAPSIEFYKSLGAKPLDEWTVFRLGEDDLVRLSTKN